MFKTLSLLLLGVLMLQSAHAQNAVKSDTLKYYFDAANIETHKETADHSIFILPKSVKDGGLYPVIGYYKDGKISLSAFLTEPTLSTKFEGWATTYYPNGNKKRTANYHEGLVTGEVVEFFENGNHSRVSSFKKNKKGQAENKITEYYPNGNISRALDFDLGKATHFFPNGSVYFIREISKDAEMDYVDCFDSTGVATAKKGTGKFIVYTDDFKAAIKQINLKQGVINGDWSPIVDSAAAIRFDHTGPIQSNVPVMPVFNSERAGSSFVQIKKSKLYLGKPSELGQFVVRNFNYPKQMLRDKTSEDVHLTMVVERNGALTHIKISHALNKAVADEIERVTLLSAPWDAGTLADGTPARVSVDYIFKFIFQPDKSKVYPDVSIYPVSEENNVALTDAEYNRTDTAYLSGNVDKQPEYPGGMEGIRKTIYNSIQYPRADREVGRKGKVYVQFIIEKDGHVSNVHAISGPSSTMKAEGERAIKLSSLWQPGFVNGKPVRVIYILPITFALETSDNLSTYAPLHQKNNNAVAAPKINNTADTSLEEKPEVMPEFPGGIEAFGSFLTNNIKFPEIDRKNGSTGKVLIKFIVEEDGTLSNFKIIKSPSQSLSNEAIRVLKLSPKWKPGYNNGKAVKTPYTVPIVFSITEEGENIDYGYEFNGIVNNEGLINDLGENPDSVRKTLKSTPRFHGGGERFGAFLGRYLNYPAEDIENGVQGAVFIKLIVETDGTLSTFEITSAPSKTLAKESLRVLKLSPKWIPAFDKNGTAIKTSITIPVNFSIEGASTPKNNRISQILTDSEDLSMYPQFPGGYDALADFLAKKLNFPNTEKGKDVTIRVSLTVEHDGSLSNFKALGSPNKAFADEAIKVLKLSPKWIPARDKDGNPIKMNYIVPVRFGH